MDPCNTHYININIKIIRRIYDRYSWLTTIYGLSLQLNFKKLLLALKREFSCGGWILEYTETEKVIILEGDQRKNILNFFIENKKICQKSRIVYNS